MGGGGIFTLLSPLIAFEYFFFNFTQNIEQYYPHLFDGDCNRVILLGYS